MSEEEIRVKIAEITDKIVREYQPEKIILFGSYAWGKPNADSDLDLFIIKDTKEHPFKRMEEVDRIFPRRKIALDFLIYTPEQVEKRKKMGDFFVLNILNKGKVLYE